jgi:hypothetical protein
MEPTPFHVETVPQAVIDLMSLSQRAVGLPRHSKILAAVTLAEQRLVLEARDIGDPLYGFKKLKMTIRGLIQPPLYFEYAVHDDAPVVVIRRVLYVG